MLRSSKPHAFDRTRRSPSARSEGCGPAKSDWSTAEAGAAARTGRSTGWTFASLSTSHTLRVLVGKAAPTVHDDPVRLDGHLVGRLLLSTETDGHHALEVTGRHRGDDVRQRERRASGGRPARVVGDGAGHHHGEHLGPGDPDREPRAVVGQRVHPGRLDRLRYPAAEAEHDPVDASHVASLHRGQHRLRGPTGRGWSATAAATRGIGESANTHSPSTAAPRAQRRPTFTATSEGSDRAPASAAPRAIGRDQRPRPS